MSARGNRVACVCHGQGMQVNGPLSRGCTRRCFKAGGMHESRRLRGDGGTGMGAGPEGAHF